jgi:hypothetical protein
MIGARGAVTTGAEDRRAKRDPLLERINGLQYL